MYYSCVESRASRCLGLVHSTLGDLIWGAAIVREAKSQRKGSMVWVGCGPHNCRKRLHLALGTGACGHVRQAWFVSGWSLWLSEKTKNEQSAEMTGLLWIRRSCVVGGGARGRDTWAGHARTWRAVVVERRI